MILEDPVPPDNVDTMAEVASLSLIHIFFAFLLYLLYGKEWFFVLIINGNIKPCEVEIIQSISSLTTSEHIPKGIIPTVEDTENIITTSASHNKIRCV